MPVLAELAQRDDNTKLQFEALWALTNIASGTSAHAHVVVEAGVLVTARQCLSLPALDVVEQAAWLLGNVAGDGTPMRDRVIKVGKKRR